jgi:NAD kinase
MVAEHIVIVINKTQLEQLVERFNTKAQSQFYIEQSGADFKQYQTGHDSFKQSLDTVIKSIPSSIKYKIIDRSFLPNYIFSDKDLVIVLGQDGLVANTAKYVKNRPIIAINPNPKRFDGQLLPFNPYNFLPELLNAFENKHKVRAVTMAEARLNNGQRLTAFNDLFIGPRTHVSARYLINYNQREEQQSSSGIIVSTGAGATGWLSSLLNMANGMMKAFNSKPAGAKAISKKNTAKSPAKAGSVELPYNMSWEQEHLVFVVREPFKSKHSGADITAGIVNETVRLQIESYMPDYGLIFSDGIEQDYLPFNSGSIASVGIASEKAHIVQNTQAKAKQ